MTEPAVPRKRRPGRPRKDISVIDALEDKDRPGLIERLEACGVEGLGGLVTILKENPRMRLSEALGKAHVKTAHFLRAWNLGRSAIAKQEAESLFHEALPALARDLRRNALDKKITCDKCGGTGWRDAGPRLSNAPLNEPNHRLKCKTCRGTGNRWMPTRYKRWAAEAVLKVTKLIEPPGGPTVNVHQQQAVLGAAPPGIFARMLEAADEVLYPKRLPVVESVQLSTQRGQGEVVDAEPTLPSPFLSLVEDRENKVSEAK